MSVSCMRMMRVNCLENYFNFFLKEGTNQIKNEKQI